MQSNLNEYFSVGCIHLKGINMHLSHNNSCAVSNHQNPTQKLPFLQWRKPSQSNCSNSTIQNTTVQKDRDRAEQQEVERRRREVTGRSNPFSDINFNPLSLIFVLIPGYAFTSRGVFLFSLGLKVICRRWRVLIFWSEGNILSKGRREFAVRLATPAISKLKKEGIFLLCELFECSTNES